MFLHWKNIFNDILDVTDKLVDIINHSFVKTLLILILPFSSVGLHKVRLKIQFWFLFLSGINLVNDYKVVVSSFSKTSNHQRFSIMNFQGHLLNLYITIHYHTLSCFFHQILCFILYSIVSIIFQDTVSGDQGILKVSLEGVSVVFVERKVSLNTCMIENY